MVNPLNPSTLPALRGSATGTSSIDPTLRPYLELGLRGAEQLFLQQQPSLYPGQMFVSPSEQTQAALNMQEDIALAQPTSLQAAQEANMRGLGGISATAGGAFLMGNPFQQAAIEAASRPIQQQFAQTTLPGIAKTSSFLLVAIFIGFAVAYWAEKPKRGGQVLGRGAIPIILVLSLFLAQNTLIERRGDVSVIELAGWETRAFLEGVSGADIMVIGEVRPNVFATKFWIDKPGIKDLLVVEGGTLAKENLDGARYIVFLGQFQMSDPHTELLAGDGFKLLKVE
jgi:hypothetical protein